MADPFDRMNPLLTQRIQSLIAAGAQNGFQISPGSGYRTMQEQIDLRTKNGCPDVWNSPASACRIPTAVPGHSNHNHGLAMDLDFGGNKDAARWANEHAAEFGLKFPVNGEDWHVELAGNNALANQILHNAMGAGALGSGDLMTAQNPTDELSARLQSITSMLAGGDYSGGKLQTPDTALHPDTTSPTTTNPFNPTETNVPNPFMQQQMNWSGKDIPPPGYVPPGHGVDRWTDVARQALQYTGQSESFLPLLLKRMAQESGGNPAAVNNWDSNAMKGDPTTGLMQNIPSAFNQRAQELADRGITDGFANIVASIRYTLQKYGSLAAWGRRGGY